VSGGHVEANRGLLGRFPRSAPIPSLTDLAPKTLIDSAIHTLALSRALISTSQIRWVTSLIDALVSSLDNGDELGACVCCGKPVAREDPFLRYGGRYYHAGSCVESDPPALRAQTHGRPAVI
jgi:hypothetical protein